MVIIPVEQITPQIDEIVKKKSLKSIFPRYHDSTNPLTQISSDDYPKLDFTFQSFEVNVSQQQLMILINYLVK
jgi:hypothetical protein